MERRSHGPARRSAESSAICAFIDEDELAAYSESSRELESIACISGREVGAIDLNSKLLFHRFLPFFMDTTDTKIRGNLVPCVD
jgi:hypothetical protein